MIADHSNRIFQQTLFRGTAQQLEEALLARWEFSKDIRDIVQQMRMLPADRRQTVFEALYRAVPETKEIMEKAADEIRAKSAAYKLSTLKP